jgi:hypothetical protein
MVWAAVYFPGKTEATQQEQLDGFEKIDGLMRLLDPVIVQTLQTNEIAVFPSEGGEDEFAYPFVKAFCT